MSVVAALHDAAATLPLRVREVEPTSTSFVLAGADWNLMVMCPIRYRTPDAVLGWESPELEDRLWDLIGQDLQSISMAHGDPVFRFSSGYALEVFADTDRDPWVLHAPGVIVVGAIPADPGAVELPRG